MKNLLRFEEAAMFAFSIFLFSLTSYPWWVFPALILAPDIGMLGYLGGSRTGALTYNLFHHKGIALAFLVSGFYLKNDAMTLAGIILFGHSSLDRMMGYGLKYTSGFNNTHLGELKQPAS